MTTLRLLRSDRPLAVVMAILTVAMLVPMVFTPILPMVDLGFNIGAAGILRNVALHNGLVGHFYKVIYEPIPYWTSYLLGAAAHAVVGAFWAAKLMVAVPMVLLPLGTMRLLAALGRNPRGCLWAFVLVWDHNAYWGWTSFSLGMALALYALAWLLEARSPREALRVIPLTLLIALTHIHAVALVGAVGVAMSVVRTPLWRSLLTHATGLSGMLIMIVPWLINQLGHRSKPGSKIPLSFDFPALSEKSNRLFDFTLNNTPLSQGVTLFSLAFFALLLAPLVQSSVAQIPLQRWQRLAALTLPLVCGLLYLTLPMSVHGAIEHWYTYPRFASYLLLAMTMVAAPRLDGPRVLALAPAVFAALAVDVAVGQQMLAFGPHARPYVEIVDHIRPNTTLLPVDLEDSDPVVKNSLYHSFHGYAAAAKQVYDPHLFDVASNPIAFRHENMPPTLNWFRQADFSLEKQGLYYNYITIRGLGRDPIKPGPTPQGPTVRLVHQAGNWRLYEVESPLPPP